MAKAKKSAKEASNIFHNIMQASVKGNPKPAPKKNDMTQLQKKIIDAIKNGFFSPDGDHVTTIDGICNLLPNEKRADIQKAISELEGVMVVGNSLDGQFSIPEKYFKA